MKTTLHHEALALYSLLIYLVRIEVYLHIYSYQYLLANRFSLTPRETVIYENIRQEVVRKKLCFCVWIGVDGNSCGSLVGLVRHQ